MINQSVFTFCSVLIVRNIYYVNFLYRLVNQSSLADLNIWFLELFNKNCLNKQRMWFKKEAALYSTEFLVHFPQSIVKARRLFLTFRACWCFHWQAEDRLYLDNIYYFLLSLVRVQGDYNCIEFWILSFHFMYKSSGPLSTKKSGFTNRKVAGLKTYIWNRGPPWKRKSLRRLI